MSDTDMIVGYNQAGMPVTQEAHDYVQSLGVTTSNTVTYFDRPQQSKRFGIF